MKSVFKGWLGEGVSAVAMWLLLDKSIYRRFNNVIVPSANGTTQIDHVIVSPYGVFVIETKNYKGWIFGDERQAQWTQCLAGGRKKFKFQNPLHQNYRHTQCLGDYLGLDPAALHSVVFFIDPECKLKSDLPPNVLDSGLVPYITGFRDVMLTGGEIERIAGKLEGLKDDPTLTRRAHLKSLDERHNSTTTCPKCGKPLVERVAKKGPREGEKFLGCSGYPGCRFVRGGGK